MHTAQRSIARFLIACALIVTLVVPPGARPVQAADQVVNNCSNDVELRADIAAMQSGGGGILTFNCGTAVIPLSGTPIISTNTTIDGGGTITLSGDNKHLLFVVDSGASLTLRNIVLTNGSYSGDGGAIINNGALTLENSTIRNSQSGASGGAIVSYGRLTIINSLLEDNEALNGGALYPRWPGSQTTIVNSVLRNNRATGTTDGWGGAILAWDGAPVTIEGSDIYSNTARFGGAIYNFANSVLTLGSNARLRDNRVINDGGGIYNAGTATLTNVTLSGNWAEGGGGGGIYNSNAGTATLIDVTLSGNLAFTEGGGLYNAGTATLTNATVSDSYGQFNGGGIYNAGTATLTNATFSGNSTSGHGGGIYNASGTAMLTNVTLSGNWARTGGGISQQSGSVSVKNTIVAKGVQGEDCAGAVTNAGFNLASDGSCGFNPVPTLMLGPLADNGGPTLTHMPQPGSPAIDFVASGCPPPTTDQRNASRPADGDGNGSARCDAGAVEYGVAVAPAWLVLLYIAADDVPPASSDGRLVSLDEPASQLLGRLSALPANPAMRLAVLFDGNQQRDSRIYVRQPGAAAGLNDMTAAAAGSSFWPNFPADSELDTGRVSTLQNFIRWARQTYPGSQHTMLSIINHGGGWAPDLGDAEQRRAAVTTQAGGWRGMSLDFLSAYSLSTVNTGEVFKNLGDMGKFDVLFFDACLMGMVETAYEVQPYAQYFIAGENLLWAELPYDKYLAPDVLNGLTTPRDLATTIVQRYNHGSKAPYTIAAVDASKLPDLRDKTNALAQALLAALPGAPVPMDDPVRARITAAYQAAQKFDYDVSLELDPTTDGYVDLADFARLLAADSGLPEAVRAAARTVFDTIYPPGQVIIAARALSGTVSTSKGVKSWDFSRAYGLSIYLPLGEQDCRPTGQVNEAATDPLRKCDDNEPPFVRDPVSGEQVATERQLYYYSNCNFTCDQIAFTRHSGETTWAHLLLRLEKNTPIRGLQGHAFKVPFQPLAPRNIYMPLVLRR